MEGRLNFEFEAFGPYRVVVVLAVESESVDPVAVAARFRRYPHRSLDRPAHITRHHDGLEAEFANRIFEFGDCLLRRMHRDGRDRQEAVGIAGEHVDLHLVERAAYCGTHFVVRNLDGEKAERRIDDRKIETKFRKTLMEQLREHRGRKILRMAGRQCAPGGAHAAALVTFEGRKIAPARVEERIVVNVAKALDYRGAADVFEVIPKNHVAFDLMAVRIDDRLAQAGANCGGLGRVFRFHGSGNLPGRRNVMRATVLCESDVHGEALRSKWTPPCLLYKAAEIPVPF